ncbi:MAG: LysM peptidoglycan-binding domain-containing protein [Phycisphaerales bacterium]|nr:LysM peptidoglycan-binding domain-containing protein [Phycisphaerales bacterium]
MTAAMRLGILAVTVGILLIVVIVGSSMAPAPSTPAKEDAAAAVEVHAAGQSSPASRSSKVSGSGVPDVVMGAPLPASMAPPRPTPLPVTRRGLVARAPGPVDNSKLLDRWTVGPQDTLTEIAAKALGASSRWREIVAINPGLDPNRLRPGQVIKLPTGASATASAASSSTANSSASKTYVVRSGDTLSSIAQRLMGSPNDWRALFDANKRVMRGDPDRLAVGMTLVIPGR